MSAQTKGFAIGVIVGVVACHVMMNKSVAVPARRTA